MNFAEIDALRRAAEILLRNGYDDLSRSIDSILRPHLPDPDSDAERQADEWIKASRRKPKQDKSSGWFLWSRSGGFYVDKRELIPQSVVDYFPLQRKHALDYRTSQEALEELRQGLIRMAQAGISLPQLPE